MFSKILIANRGEIARRVIKTCRKMGINTVAVYSEADTAALHVKEADASVAIGGYAPRESYLIIEKIIAAAQKTGAEAIHPGYGFLSENADFATAVAGAGMTFIGPSPAAIRALGDKTAARELAIASRVPISPGSAGAVSEKEAALTAARIGFPVLLKAAAGGGGKGMRLVEKPDEFEAAFRAASGEAMAAFGDDRMFVEKFIVNPRHIEIQILADNYGNILYFPERECSIQRRHQKVVEESPSTAITPHIRRAMGEAAARLVENSGYTNAGTLEFLLDASGDFYFMEVNTRLQVEHPITEMVTGVDLVEQQLRIAAGEKLALKQEQIIAQGHAIECRICAEDVYNDFLPETGIVSYVATPKGEHIRNDDALNVGYEVTVNYDSMAGKLICWGASRDEAIGRSIAALDSYRLAGLRTTIPFCRYVLDSAPFRSGNYSTHYVAEHWKPEIPEELRDILAAAAFAGITDIAKRRTPVFSEQIICTNK
ncbi:acetyl-CoA carboxylase biotin carboxylase subunit [Ignavibacteria bacterium]|nr:acetyl-CoA carboxylase biotin carboxylase subunit [Bacteroidota bacterium]MCZ2133042.1 acetyl-CoA carboxylase biotin carboxylase subunit [Bacteroidota bacterium]